MNSIQAINGYDRLNFFNAKFYRFNFQHDITPGRWLWRDLTPLIV